MQKIDIDWIIGELKKSDEWKEYTNYLWIDFFHKKETVEELLQYWKLTLLDCNFPDWKDREKIFPIFKKLENQFVKLFLEKYKFCPYCWKHPLILYKNNNSENKRFFDLDHFFPKNSYKNLTYNFYNLIPSCKLCNWAKSTKNFIKSSKVWDKIFHPYFWYIKRQDWRKNQESKLLILNDKYYFNLSSFNSEFFKLKEIYLNSQDTKNDIWFIRDKIEKIKTDKINSKKLNLTFDSEERKDLFFKNFYPKNEEDILKFANWKLKKDLIENIKI